MTEQDTFTQEQRRKIDNAWRVWQSEESRDRGYDFDLCQRLREKYYAAIAEAKEENKELSQ